MLLRIFVFVPSVREDELKVAHIEVTCKPFIPEDVGDKRGLLVLKHTDLLLDRISREETVGNNLVLLSDTVRSINRLVLHRRVPPWIIEDYVRGRGEVESRSTSLQGEKEDLSLIHI